MRIYLIGPEALARDLFMLVDDIDADLTRVCWSYNPVTGYACSQWPRGSRSRPRPANRVILERMIERPLSKGERVDHINRDKLDNRRENLRLATHQQNKWNTDKQQRSDGRPYTSQYKGVSFDKARGKWIAKIRCDGHNRSVGRYDSEIEAAQAYDRAAREHFGEFARCNFP